MLNLCAYKKLAGKLARAEAFPGSWDKATNCRWKNGITAKLQKSVYKASGPRTAREAVRMSDFVMANEWELWVDVICL